MKIEVLFPEFCNLFGDAYNMVYLEKTLPEAEFIRTKFSDDVRFTEEKMNLVYMGPMTERMQEQVIRKLMPLKEKIQKAIDDGTVFLFTGNALEIFGDYIENEDALVAVECLFDVDMQRFAAALSHRDRNEPSLIFHTADVEPRRARQAQHRLSKRQLLPGRL